MMFLLILSVFGCAALFVLRIIEASRDKDVLPDPRPDRVVNNWKYSGLPPR